MTFALRNAIRIRGRSGLAWLTLLVSTFRGSRSGAANQLQQAGKRLRSVVLIVDHERADPRFPFVGIGEVRRYTYIRSTSSGLHGGQMQNDSRLIKKYPNRRLYDTSTSSYITLAEIKEMVASHP